MRNDDIPAYNEITSKKIQTGFQKLTVSYDAHFNNLINEFETSKLYQLIFIKQYTNILYYSNNLRYKS